MSELRQHPYLEQQVPTPLAEVSLESKRQLFARAVGEFTIASTGAAAVFHGIFPSVSAHFPKGHEDLIFSSSTGNITDDPGLVMSALGLFAASIMITHVAGIIITKPELIREAIENTKTSLVNSSKVFTQWVRTILPKKPVAARRAFDSQIDTDSALQA